MIILETERLRLREMTLDDVDAIHAVIGDPEALALWPRTYTRDEAVGWVQRSLGRYETHGYGLWAVTLKTSGECLGDCGIVARTVDGRTEDEIGYHLQKRHWGQGYATEAALACRDHAFGRLGKSRVISLIMPHNTPSRRVAERVGMQVEGETFIETGGVHLVYSVAAPR